MIKSYKLWYYLEIIDSEQLENLYDSYRYFKYFNQHLL